MNFNSLPEGVKHIQDILDADKAELEEVLSSIREKEILSENINDADEDTFTFGQRLADKIAKFGGSRTFILSFLFFLIAWMALNIALGERAWDEYPFILLNLCLSSLAALQAPVIMMSQNRQAQRDRLRAENDYKVNLKAEIEIRTLHEKLDHLMLKKRETLMEIQQIQLTFLEKDKGNS